MTSRASAPRRCSCAAGGSDRSWQRCITPARRRPMGPLPHRQRGAAAGGGHPARRRRAAAADDGAVRLPARRGRSGGQAVRRHGHADRRRRRAARPRVRRAGRVVLDVVHRRAHGGGGGHPRRRPIIRPHRGRVGGLSGRAGGARRRRPPRASARAKVARMATAGPIVDDLRAESDDLDELVADLPAARWAEATPAPGWTIAHQIAHLLWTDRVALIVGRRRSRLHDGARGRRRRPERIRRPGRRRHRRRRGARRAAGRLAEHKDHRLHDELLTVPDGRKLPWFGPPMSAASMATARLMETWAHGLDVADALGVQRPATARLRSIAHIGVRTRDFAFAINGLDRAGGSVPGRAARPRRLDLDVGAGGRRAAGDGLGRGLLRAGDPAAPAGGARRHGRR